MEAASLALPRVQLDAWEQGLALLGAVTVIMLFVLASVRDVMLVVIDAAMVFESVAARLDRLVRPMIACLTVYALQVLVFAHFYRIAVPACPARAHELCRFAI